MHLVVAVPVTAGKAPGRVFFVTRKPLVHNSRVFNQVGSLRRAGYDVLLLGVARGDLPFRDYHQGTPIVRVAHDPMPRRLSVWLRRGGGSPAHAQQSEGFAGASPRRRVLRLIRRVGTLPWLAQSLSFYIRTVRVLSAVSPAPTVVHATDLNALPAAAIVARLRHVPLVYDAQELFTGMHTLPALYRRLLGLQERLLLRAVDRFIVVNPHIGEVMARRYGRQPDAVVLNCPPFEALPDTPARPDGPPQLIYSGGLLPQRGVEQVVLALPQLPEARLLILGEGPLEAAVRRLANEHGVSARLTIRDFVEPSEMTRLLATADVGVLPYQDVGLNHRLCSPSKLFHYLMAGLPVVGSDLPFVRSVIVGNQVGEVFDQRSPTQLAAAVQRVMADPDAYRARIMDVRRRFSWDHEEQAFLGVYRSLGAGGAPAAGGRMAAPRRVTKCCTAPT